MNTFFRRKLNKITRYRYHVLIIELTDIQVKTLNHKDSFQNRSSL
jgi:hypothetical protein